MITTLVQFKLPQPLSREKAQELFEGMAPEFREVPGLMRKYFLLTQDGESVGGVYLWNTRSDADARFIPQWRESVEARFGSVPTVDYFESPVVVDNVTGEIQRDD